MLTRTTLIATLIALAACGGEEGEMGRGVGDMFPSPGLHRPGQPMRLVPDPRPPPDGPARLFGNTSNVQQLTGTPASLALVSARTSDSEPHQITLAAGVQRAPAGGEPFPGAGGVWSGQGSLPGPFSRMYLDVEYMMGSRDGSTGGSKKFRVDLGRSRIVNVFATHVIATVTSELDPAGAAAGETPTVWASANMDCAVPVGDPPTRTVEQLSAGGGPFTALIPDFATKLRVLRGGVALPNPAFTAIFQDSQGNNIAQFPVAAGAEMADYVPIPDRATSVLMSVAAGTVWQLVFQLSI